MTGIEILRKMGADAIRGGEVGRTICDIADQIERETYDAAEVRKDAERALCVELDAPIDEGADPLDVLRRYVENLNDTIENLRLELGEARDRSADVSMSAYDLLPQEERDAIAWVREHGGLERVNLERDQLYGVLRETCDLLDVSYFGVWTTDAQSIWRKLDWYKARLGESVPRSCAERRVARRQRQIDESHAALRRRNARIAELERERDELRTRVENQRASLDGLAAAIDEMRPRLMPEGMCWPVYEDGEPVKFGDVVSDGDETGRVYYVTFDTVNPVIIGFTDETPDQDPGTWLEVSVNDGERVKRPAPMVRDADGAEIRVGDTVWHEDGSELVVEGFGDEEDGETLVKVSDMSETSFGWSECRSLSLTHRAPVLAADGLPLREGETAWDKDTGDRFEVDGFSEDGFVVCWDLDKCEADIEIKPSQLTHERPESKCRDCKYWQKDPTADNMGVCWFYYHEHEGQDCYAARLADIGACEEFMPRARALAERDA